LTFKTALAFGMITFIAQLLVAVVTLLYGIPIVLPEIVNYSYPVYLAAPFLITLFRLSGDALAAYYLLIVAAVIMSTAWLFLKSSRGYARELLGKANSREHSAIFDLCGLTFGILFFDFTFVLILSLFGLDLTDATSGSPLWELLFTLANASVWEEIVVRVLLIGLPLLIIDLYRRSSKRKISYILGGGFALGLPETALLVLSSAIFGIAHFEGWGAWKVFPASVAGLAFGYMFLRHGLASAIILHFGFNYMSLPSEVFDGSVFLVVMTGLGLLLWIALGFVFFIYYCSRMAEFVSRRKYFEPATRVVPTNFRPIPGSVPYGNPVYGSGTYSVAGLPPVDVSHNQPMPNERVNRGWPGGLFMCPWCGYTEARWLEGKFQCLRCGRLS
jgi:hypothetical protein